MCVRVCVKEKQRPSKGSKGRARAGRVRGEGRGGRVRGEGEGERGGGEMEGGG